MKALCVLIMSCSFLIMFPISIFIFLINIPFMVMYKTKQIKSILVNRKMEITFWVPFLSVPIGSIYPNMFLPFTVICCIWALYLFYLYMPILKSTWVSQEKLDALFEFFMISLITGLVCIILWAILIFVGGLLLIVKTT